jgi:hypothetical protein
VHAARWDEMGRRFVAIIDGVVGESTSVVDLEAFRVAKKLSHAEAIDVIAGLLVSGAIVSSADCARWAHQGK